MAMIGMIGSHSAEEIALAAKRAGFETFVFCQQNREKLYSSYNRFLYDEIMVLPEFSSILDHQDYLEEKNVIFIPNRSFAVYLGYDLIEKELRTPIYGNRAMLRIEDRKFERNQNWLLAEAGIRKPKQFSPSDIPALAIVKAQQKHNQLERAFFYVASPDDYDEKTAQLVKSDVVAEEDLKNAIIEEFVLGPRFNANVQSYALIDQFGDFDFVGFDDRLQSNLAGILNLPARDQLQVEIPLKNEEVGHFGVTMRESKKPMVYDAAYKFLRASEKHFPPGMIGLFSLQGAINEHSEFVVFDVSPRVPGSPCVGPTSPEMARISFRLNRKIESALDLSMLELKYAIEQHRVEEVTT
ncbi:MAG: DUF1297 domain-containing protein [Candidatus Heimdallarchaeota archaeon]